MNRVLNFESRIELGVVFIMGYESLGIYCLILKCIIFVFLLFSNG